METVTSQNENGHIVWLVLCAPPPHQHALIVYVSQTIPNNYSLHQFLLSPIIPCSICLVCARPAPLVSATHPLWTSH
jgi:hypothetical protein